MNENFPLPEDVRRLLEQERRLETPPAAQLDRIWDRVLHSAYLPPTPGNPPNLIAGNSLATWAVVFAAAGVLVGGALILFPRSDPPSSAVAPRDPETRGAVGSASSDSAVEAPAPPALEPRLEAPPPVRTSKTPAEPPGRLAAADAPALGRERAILESARAALREGRHELALVEAARHETAFPRGQLAEEREAIAIRALAALGRWREVRSRAAAFKRAFPQSMLLPLVEATEAAAP